jgi:DNA-binding response OmpR family regulator
MAFAAYQDRSLLSVKEVADATRFLVDRGFIVLPPIRRDDGAVVVKRSRLEIVRGATVELLSPLESRLMTALMLAEGAWVSTNDLCDVLWGDTPPKRGAFHVLIFNIRAKFKRCALDDMLLETSRKHGCRLDLGAQHYLR